MEESSGGPVDRYLASIEAATIDRCDALSPDIVLDATVPSWRFTVRGAAGVRDELGRWFAHPGRFEELLRSPLPNGELVEFTLAWEENGVPHAVHQAHVLEVAQHHIVADRTWCGGRWPASLLAEMAQAAQDV